MNSYVIVSPVRNEGKYLRRTVESVVRQTCLPSRWILVDDGSTDDTREIAEAAARQFSWIEVVVRADRGGRVPGTGVMEAFYAGFDRIGATSWDFLAKLDGDLEFDPHFFQRLLEAFAQDPRLGIAGGDIYYDHHGARVIESGSDPAFHVRGATKFYRRECWDVLGGLVRSPGWDTLDEVKANMMGWRTGRIPEAQVLHLRPTGAADGAWRNAFKNGRGSFISGYHPLYMVVKCCRRAFSWPFLVQSCGLFAGYFSSYFGGVKRIPDQALVRYLRAQQIRRILGMSSLWH